MRKFGRKVHAGLCLMFYGFPIQIFLGEKALREFEEAMGNYVQTGVMDHSWADKYHRRG